METCPNKAFFEKTNINSEQQTVDIRKRQHQIFINCKNAINFKNSNTNLKVNDEIINITESSEIIAQKIKMTTMATKILEQIQKDKNKNGVCCRRFYAEIQ